MPPSKSLKLDNAASRLDNNFSLLHGTLAIGFDTPADSAQIRIRQAMRAAGCHNLSRRTAVFAVSASLVALMLVSGIYGLFRGLFDTGAFEIKQVQWSPSKRVAMLAERSDKQALGGLTYFVVVDKHLLSPSELKLAYHSDAVIFDAMATCLNLHWETPSNLVVSCNGSHLDQDYINVEKRQSGDVAISYLNISPDTAQTFRPK